MDPLLLKIPVMVVKTEIASLSEKNESDLVDIRLQRSKITLIMQYKKG